MALFPLRLGYILPDRTVENIDSLLSSVFVASVRICGFLFTNRPHNVVLDLRNKILKTLMYANANCTCTLHKRRRNAYLLFLFLGRLRNLIKWQRMNLCQITLTLFAVHSFCRCVSNSSTLAKQTDVEKCSDDVKIRHGQVAASRPECFNYRHCH